MNTNPYFTHCISNSIAVPNAPTKEKRGILYKYFSRPSESSGIKSSICKVLDFDVDDIKNDSS